jgi:hypothetical protein
MKDDGTLAALNNKYFGTAFSMSYDNIEDGAYTVVLPELAYGGVPELLECSGQVSAVAGADEDTVSLSVITLDLEALVRLNINLTEQLGDQAATWETIVQMANERGGVCGRTIDFEVDLYDIITAGSGDEACIRQTQDRVNVIVIATEGLEPESLACLAASTPVIYDEALHTDLADAGGNNVFVTGYSGAEGLAASIAYYEAGGYLEGKLGILRDDADPSQQDTVEQYFVDALTEQGYEILDCLMPGSATTPEGWAKLPLCIEDFMSGNVDTLFLAVTITTFSRGLNMMAEMGFTPRVLPLSSGGSNKTGSSPAISKLFGTDLTPIDGMPVLFFETSSAMDPTESEMECAADFTAASGEVLEVGTLRYGNVVRTCSLLQLALYGISAAGDELSSESVVRGLESATAFQLGNSLNGGFGPGDHIGLNELAELVFDVETDSYTVTGTLIPLG